MPASTETECPHPPGSAMTVRFTSFHQRERVLSDGRPTPLIFTPTSCPRSYFFSHAPTCPLSPTPYCARLCMFWVAAHLTQNVVHYHGDTLMHVLVRPHLSCMEGCRIFRSCQRAGGDPSEPTQAGSPLCSTGPAPHVRGPQRMWTTVKAIIGLQT